MLRPTDRVNKAISSLQGNPNWDEFRTWLELSYAKEATDHVRDTVSPDSKYRIGQGVSLALYELIQIIKSARTEASKK
jgi:hypothetical protein